MSLQEVFYILASIFMMVFLIATIFLTIVAYKLISKLNNISASIDSKLMTTDRFLKRTQVGVLSTFLGLLRLFR